MDLAAYAVSEMEDFGEEENGMDSPSPANSPRRNYAFCSERNLPQCTNYVNQELSSLGLMTVTLPSAHMSPRSASHSQEFTVQLVNCVYDLLQQHRHDIHLLQQKDNKVLRMTSEVSIQRSTQLHLREQLQAAEREAAGCTERERQCSVINKSLNGQIRNLKEELRRTKADHQYRVSQMTHESRKNERELTKLKDRLANQSSQRGSSQLSQLRVLNEVDRRRGTWSKANGSHELDLYKRVVGQHEARQQELVTENAELREMLTGMQQEVSSLLKNSPLLAKVETNINQHGEAPPPRSRSSSQSTPTSSGSVEHQRHLPHAGFLQAMEESLLGRWQALKEELKMTLGKPTQALESPTREGGDVPATPRTLELEVLRKKMANYEELLAGKERALQTQLDVKLGGDKPRPYVLSASRIATARDQLAADRALVQDQRHQLEEERDMLMRVAQEMDKKRLAMAFQTPGTVDSAVRRAHEFLDSSIFEQARSASPTLSSPPKQSPATNGWHHQAPPSSLHESWPRFTSPQSLPAATSSASPRSPGRPASSPGPAPSPIREQRASSHARAHRGKSRTPRNLSGGDVSWVAHSSPLIMPHPAMSASVPSASTSTPRKAQAPCTQSPLQQLPQLQQGVGLHPSHRPAFGSPLQPPGNPLQSGHSTPKSSPRPGSDMSRGSPSQRLAQFLNESF